METVLIHALETCLFILGILIITYLGVFLYSEKCEEITFSTDNKKYRISKKLEKLIEKVFSISAVSIIIVVLVIIIICLIFSLL